jgi:hypothetical protein
MNTVDTASLRKLREALKPLADNYRHGDTDDESFRIVSPNKQVWLRAWVYGDNNGTESNHVFFRISFPVIGVYGGEQTIDAADPGFARDVDHFIEFCRAVKEGKL